MSLIDNTYFSGDIMLSGGQLDNIQEWIDIYEAQILTKLLGYTLYTALVADLNGTTEPTLQIFKDLVDGKAFEFTYNGYDIPTKWIGLRDKTTKKSLIAYYVYFQYRNETESYNSGGAGQKLGVAENGSNKSVIPKLTYAYNKCIDIYGSVPKQLSNTDYYLNKANYEHYNSIPTVYNFLLAETDTYPTWIFEPIRKLNIYSL